MRWVFGTAAALCAVILFVPLGGNSAWSEAGICGSAVGQFAQHYSASAQSNCAVNQMGTFVLCILIVVFVGLTILFQRRHTRRSR